MGSVVKGAVLRDMSEKINIVLTRDTYNKLRAIGKKGETFDQIISKLLVTDDRD